MRHRFLNSVGRKIPHWIFLHDATPTFLHRTSDFNMGGRQRRNSP